MDIRKIIPSITQSIITGKKNNFSVYHSDCTCLYAPHHSDLNTADMQEFHSVLMQAALLLE